MTTPCQRRRRLSKNRPEAVSCAQMHVAEDTDLADAEVATDEDLADPRVIDDEDLTA